MRWETWEGFVVIMGGLILVMTITFGLCMLADRYPKVAGRLLAGFALVMVVWAAFIVIF